MAALLFWAFAAMAVAMAAVVVTHHNPVACALALAAVLFGLAALFVTLEAFFLAIVQIIVYAGAVMTLFVFIIMLLDVKEEEKRFSRKSLAIVSVMMVLFGIFFSGVLASLLHSHEAIIWKDQTMGENIRQVGKLLFTGYMLPFLITGVLLLLATIGVVLLNRKDTAP